MPKFRHTCLALCNILVVARLPACLPAPMQPRCLAYQALESYILITMAILPTKEAGWLELLQWYLPARPLHELAVLLCRRNRTAKEAAGRRFNTCTYDTENAMPEKGGTPEEKITCLCICR